MNLVNEVKDKFLTGDTLTRLLLVNCGMFVLVLLMYVLITVFGFNVSIDGIFQFPAFPDTLIFRPWTLATSMFTSYGLWHFLFNMLVLYWIGGIFQQYFTNTHLRGMYIIGALAGMLSYTAAYQTVQFVSQREWSTCMPMASCAILALTLAVTFRSPNHQEQVPLIGNVKIKYIAILIALADIALLPNLNPATDVAHAGAAVSGWLFNRMLSKGHDITRPVTSVFVWLYGLKKKK